MITNHGAYTHGEGGNDEVQLHDDKNDERKPLPPYKK